MGLGLGPGLGPGSGPGVSNELSRLEGAHGHADGGAALGLAEALRVRGRREERGVVQAAHLVGL